LALNWIVPMRRAVVREECKYVDLIDAWRRSLHDGRESLARWYTFAAAGRHQNGLRWLASIVQSIRISKMALATPASIEHGNTLNTIPPAYVRLWKGPKRILHHAAQTDAQLGLDNAQREVRSISAEFYPGDLIEFPLHRFLAACLANNSSDAQALWGMRFHGQGHPALGNTVLTSSGTLPTGNFALHDNILAARFQMILSLALCAWSSEAPVYQDARYSGANPAAWGLLGQWGRQRVYARGMMYAGEFAINGRIRLATRAGASDPNAPTYVTDPLHTHYWRYATWHWGERQSGTRPLLYVPSSEAVTTNLRPEQPLTPGWSCSPATLALTYLLRNAPSSGRGGVSENFPNSHVENGVRFVSRESIVAAGTPPPPPPEPTPDGAAPRRTRPVAAPDRIPVCLLWADQRSNRWGGPVGDVNVVALSRHEQAIVKLFPPSRLLRSTAKPFVGFLSAFNPATGEDYFGAARHSDQFVESGQLYLFESAGSLSVVPGAPTVFGSKFFNWKPIVDNMVYLKRMPNNGTHGIAFTDPGESNSRRPQQFLSRIICMDINETTFGSEYAFGRAYRPIVIATPDARETPMSRTGRPDDYKSLYAERAVPFWTMAEFITHSGFPPLSEITEAVAASNRSNAEARASREAERAAARASRTARSGPSSTGTASQ
jgi:hypothetical protein